MNQQRVKINIDMTYLWRMNPDHCKDVSLRHVDFPLTEENISRDIVGKKAYTRTDFMILKHGDEVAVINVIKGTR